MKRSAIYKAPPFPLEPPPEKRFTCRNCGRPTRDFKVTRDNDSKTAKPRMWIECPSCDWQNLFKAIKKGTRA